MTKRINIKDWQALRTKGKFDVNTLNKLFAPLDFIDRVRLFYQLFDTKDILFTSSFGTNSVLLIDIIHKANPKQKIHFIDTTYHFEETIRYKKMLAAHYGLSVVDVLPNKVQNDLTREEQWWTDHPKMCCAINKVASLNPIVAEHRLWISGLISYQTQFRSQLNIFEKQGDIIKFHPLLDIEEGDVLFYKAKHKLLAHPLEIKGFGSVGCTHCTVVGAGREGRWQGQNKSECGLHPNYFTKKR